MTTISISLDDKDFQCLVGGGILKIKAPETTVRIALKDIGFFEMERIIAEVDESKDFYRDREREA